MNSVASGVASRGDVSAVSVNARTYFAELDALRAIAMVQGVFFHAALAFTAFDLDWAVRDVTQSRWVDAFVWLSHGFRMHLFFLVAGFFGHRLLELRGIAGFLENRLRRVGIPFVWASLTLAPLAASAWLVSGRVATGSGHLVPAHLWFLEYLLIFYAVAVLFSPLTSRPRVALAFRALMHMRGKVLVLVGATYAVSLALEPWAGEPSRRFLPYAHELAVYGLFFAFGWLLHHEPELRRKLIRDARAHALVAAVAAGSWLTLVSSPMAPATGPFKAFVDATFAWSTVLAALGLFFKYVRPGRILMRLAKASYTIYLVHVPIVVYLQIAAAPIPAPLWTKWVAISAVTLLLSVGIDGAVRRVRRVRAARDLRLSPSVP